MQLRRDDPLTAAAKEEAQRRWPEFVAAFARREPNTDYAVNAPLPLRDGDGDHEHLWFQVQSIGPDTVVGTVDNHPIGDIGYKLGDTVTLRTADIEDWLIGTGPDNITGLFSREAIKKAKQRS